MSELESWMKRGMHLPLTLRDFHDQKDVFHTMHSMVNVGGNDYAKDIDWVSGQCYVIDIFLWFMARRGYTLQRSRARLPFRDLGDDIAMDRKRRSDAFSAMIAAAPKLAGGSE